jgi:membrane-associated protease RseP (regulator of RpoE activity)
VGCSLGAATLGNEHERGHVQNGAGYLWVSRLEWARGVARVSAMPRFGSAMARVCVLGGAVALAIALVFGFGAADSGPPLVLQTQMFRAPVLGVVVDDTLQILDVDEGGVAARAGLQRGDVISGLGDQAPASPAAAKQLFASFQEGATVSIAVRRAGQQRTVPVQVMRPTGRPGAPTPTPVPQPLMYL